MAISVPPGLACMSCSLVLWAFLGYSASLLLRLTPIFTPLACDDKGADLGPVTPGLQFVNMTGDARKFCTNDNKYDVSMSEKEPGPVYWRNGTDLIPLGQTKSSDTFIAARGGTAMVKPKMLISVPVDMAMGLLEMPVMQLITEMRLISTAHISILGFTVKLPQPVNTFCGFEVRLATQKVGHIVCAGSIEELNILGVDDETVVVDHLGPSAGEVRKMAIGKNVAFTLLLAGVAALAIWTSTTAVNKMKTVEADEFKLADVKLSDVKVSEDVKLSEV